MEYSLTLNPVTSIVKKYQRAATESVESRLYFEDMTASAPAGMVAIWEKEIQTAEGNRNGNEKIMDIYQVRIKKAPSRKEIELRLAERELHKTGQTGQANWLSDGIKLEETQLVIVQVIHKMC